jgi:TPR repeat protein
MSLFHINVARLLIWSVTIVLMLSYSTTRAAEKASPNNDYGNGWIRYQLKDYRGALKLWLNAASSGNTKAMVSAAHLYRTGEGVDRDTYKASKFYAAASSLGDAEGKHNLATMYLEGNGVKRDATYALHLYNEAAAQGYVLSQQQLGFISYDQKNYSDAAKWWSKAANNGDVESQYHLALLYLFGNGVIQDDKTALILMREATKGGHSEAQKHYQRFLDINSKNTHPKE